jgi:hypothetical protein
MPMLHTPIDAAAGGTQKYWPGVGCDLDRRTDFRTLGVTGPLT